MWHASGVPGERRLSGPARVPARDVDRYVAGLGAALRGPRRVKADLLAEARDSLVDAAEAYRAGGASEREAARRAVAEFGGLSEIVPAYQAELAVAQGRRTALLIALALPLLRLLTPLIWWRSRWSGAPVGSGYLRLAQSFDDLTLLGCLLAALALLGYGWGSRYIRDGAALTRVLGRGALAFLAVHGLAGGAVYLWRLAQWPGALGWPPLWAGIALMWLAFGYAALCAWRCLATSRGTVAAG
jgi:hypothetical protein